MNRSRGILVLAIVAVLGTAIWLVLRDTDVGNVAAAIPAPSNEARSTPAPVLATPLATIEEAHPSPSPVSPTAVSEGDAASTATPSAPPSLLLYGFLLPAPSRKTLVEGAVSLTDPRGQRQLAHCGADGGYSFSGLAPGHYFVGSWSPSNGSAGVEIDLDESVPEKRLDLQLVVPYELLVKAADRAGQPLGVEFGLRPVATEEAPSEWLDGLTSNTVEHYGMGAFRTERGTDFAGGDVELGILALDRPPPVYVSLVTYQHVLATKLVEAGQGEVEFTLDRDSPARRRGTLQFRLVDAHSRAAIEPTMVMLDGFGTRNVRKEGEAFRAANLLPGWYRIQVHARGYERLGRRVLVAPAVETDLEEVGLEPEQWISGTVVDDEGRGAAMELYWVDYDREKGAAPISDTLYTVNSHGDGSFRIAGLSRGLYLVSTMSREETPWARWSKVIDTTAGPVENINVQLVRGVPLVLRATDAVNRGSLRYKILDEFGTAVRSDRFWNPKPVRLLLAPGKYVVEVSVEKGKQPTRIPITIESQAIELAIP